jgi:hypothetical protein
MIVLASAAGGSQPHDLLTSDLNAIASVEYKFRIPRDS